MELFNSAVVQLNIKVHYIFGQDYFQVPSSSLCISVAKLTEQIYHKYTFRDVFFTF